MKNRIAAIAGLIGLIAVVAGFIVSSTTDIGINPLYWLLAVGVGYLIYRRDVPLAAASRVLSVGRQQEWDSFANREFRLI